MECSACKRSYAEKDKGRIPRVLVKCGHTFCEKCIEQAINENEVQCWECRVSSEGKLCENFPINYTLLALLNKESHYRCEIHGERLEAYCEKDNKLLCVNCIISSEHKYHKFTKIAEKVQKDKKILEQCHLKIQQAKEDSIINLEQTKGIEIELEQQNIEIVQSIQTFYAQLKQELQKQENEIINQSNHNLERYLQNLKCKKTEIEEKQHFIAELEKIYEEVINLADLQYLYQNNKRIFIMENCKVSQNPVSVGRIGFDKNYLISKVKGWLASQEERTEKNNNKEEHESPIMMCKRGKQPAVLAVNLNDEYYRHCIRVKKKNPRKAIRVPIDLSKSARRSSEEQTSSFLNGDESLNRDLENEVTLGEISSFMHSSRGTSSLKDEKEFTICSIEEQILHFGGNRVECYKIESQEIMTLPINITIPLRSHCIRFKKYNPNKILIITGNNKTNAKNEENSNVLEYDIHHQSIHYSLLKINCSRSGFAALVNQHRIYVVGGKLESEITNLFEEYTLGNVGLYGNKLASMSEHRDEFGSCLGLDGCLYVCGGINRHNKTLSRCEKYDWKVNQWQELPKMKIPRSGVVLVALPNAIYAIGGYHNRKALQTVEMLNYDSKQWITVAPLLTPRYMITALTTADFNSIIVFGGSNTIGPLNSSEKYSILKNEWSVHLDMHEARSEHCSIDVSI